jgi:WD40 repeat protein
MPGISDEKIKAVVGNADGSLVFTASRDKSVRAWRLGVEDVAVQTRAHSGHQGFVNSLLYVPARNGVGAHVVSGGADKRLILWMVDDPLWPAVVIEDAHNNNICALAVTSTGIASGSWDKYDFVHVCID